ncbi:MAG: anthranilate synthase component I [Pseudomonadales bacterium]
MKIEQFNQLTADGFNRIPLQMELLADIDTPLSTYMKIGQGPYSFLLESVEGGETWGRYSIIGLPCKTVLRVYGHEIQLCETGNTIDSWHSDAPLESVQDYQKQFRVPDLDGLPIFHGGLVGYFAYDAARYAEPRLDDGSAQLIDKPSELQNPDILLMLADEIIVFDNLSGTLKIVVLCDPDTDDSYQKGQARLSEISDQLRKATLSVRDIPLDNRDAALSDQEGFGSSSFKRSDFEAAVERIKEYILAGDCMQVVLSQRLSAEFNAEPIDLYRALRLLNPSPYMYFLDLGDFQIVGSSPEILARLQDETVTVRPIAGTRRRGRSEAEDMAMEKELLNDPKELAEHLMLIDLGRNDVGRIAATGTVALTEKMIIERYSHVMHIVSKVSGQLLEQLDAVDVLKACLPAGTLSGAPKIRAMEIIDELEPCKRGIYGGAVGYISWQGDMDTAIAIRTAVIQDKRIYCQAGAGIVADSEPALEWQECMNKASAIFKAAQLCC